MNRKLQLVILLVLFAVNSVLADVGESAGNEILNSNPGARAMGFGGAFAGLADSLSAIQTNPAGLSYLTNSEILTSYNQGLFETQYAFFGFAKPCRSRPGAFACSVETLQDEDIELNFTNPDSSFKETKTVKAGCDYLATLSYSQLIGKEVSVGINAKFLQSTLVEQYKATAYAGDIGFLIRPVGDRIRFGIAARNFGTGLKYLEKEDSLQREYICGMSVRLFETDLNKLSFMGDYVKNETNRFNLGFEYLFQKKFAVRAGYRIGYDIGAFTAGVGFNFGGMGIDYAFVDRGVFDDTHIVSVSMKFGQVSHYHTGKNYFDRKMFERAINEWSKVPEENPDYKKIDAGMSVARNHILAEKFYSQGKKCLRKGDYEKALGNYQESEKAVKGYKKCGEYIRAVKLLVSGISLIGEERYEDAIEKFNKAAASTGDLIIVLKSEELKRNTLSELAAARKQEEKRIQIYRGKEMLEESEKMFKEREKMRKQGRINVAVADFEGRPPISASEAAFITDFFRKAMIDAEIFSVVERKNMDKILAEQGFQQTGCTTEDCAVQMGKLLNAHMVITGSCGKLLSRFILTINIVDVETGKFIYSEKVDCYSEREIENMTSRLVEKINKQFR